MVGGMVSEGRVLLCWPPCRMSASPILCVVVPLNGGGAGVCCPRVRIGSSPFILFLSLLRCLSSPPLPLSTVCVLCHSIVVCVLCLCDRVVSLWNSGGDLCGAEGRVVCGVWCALSTLYALCCVVGCGMAVV